MSAATTTAPAVPGRAPRARVRTAPWLSGVAAALLLAWLPAASALSPAADPGVARLLQLTVQAEDDPRSAVREADRLLAAAVPAERFWLLLAKSRGLALLEDYAQQGQAVAEAVSALAALPQPAAAPRLWLRIEQLSLATSSDSPPQLAASAATLRRDVQQHGDALIGCELTGLEFWLLHDARSLDEAWLAAEELERCGRHSGLAFHLYTGYAGMGQVASASKFERSQGRDATEYFERALAALAGQPARFRRSVIEWDLGNALRRAKKLTAAMEHLRQAMELSRELGDRAGVAAANITIARIRLDLGAHDEMLPLLEQALEALRGHDNGPRIVQALELRILALARLKQPRVLAEIDAARAHERGELQPSMRAALARAMAEGYASQQAWSRGYLEMQRAYQLDQEGRDLARDSQVLRLQSRYDSARRDAETAELRHRSEIARMDLERSSAQRERLIVATALLAVLAAAGIGFATRLWQRRRAFAALALRDELTGSSNRRAVTAYAHAQFEQARRLRVPLTLALIDLDLFKAVNDRFGHAAGDDLLRAFVESTRPVLRGQDRLGRWGGEEWLLVLPGTGIDELPRLFARIRESYARVVSPGLPVPHGQTFSMGGAALSAQTPTLAALIAAADAQLYRAKGEGRDRLYVVHTPVEAAAAGD